MRRCYISKSYKELNSAGSKAKTDIETILSLNGFINLGLPHNVCKNRVRGFILTLLSVLKGCISMKKGDVLVLQYPFKKYYVFICKFALIRGAKTITLIHDLGTFRRKKLTSEKEIKRLSNSDYLIAHNENMKKWLLDHGCRQPIGCLGIFDYLSDSSAKRNKEILFPYKVVYAGGLSPKKNRFLYDLINKENVFLLSLYGAGFNVDKIENKESFSYMGFIPSDVLISTVRGEFGLVWDGDSIDVCSGTYGEYLKYNNPHKTSLYLRCGLPVIIWEQAAMAKFIADNKIGIVVANLANLNAILAKIDINEYNALRENVLKISDKLSKGYCTSKAIEEAIKVL